MNEKETPLSLRYYTVWDYLLQTLGGLIEVTNGGKVRQQPDLPGIGNCENKDSEARI